MYVTINYNMYTICIHNTARSKTIPLMCTHVYSYMFSTVHPRGGGVVHNMVSITLCQIFRVPSIKSFIFSFFLFLFLFWFLSTWFISKVCGAYMVSLINHTSIHERHLSGICLGS